MAAPITGEWARQNLQYSGAEVWGTGLNPVHYQYGSPDARIAAVRQREGEVTPPFQAVPDAIEQQEMWGYTPEDSSYTGMSYGDRPNWTDEPSNFRTDTEQQPPWSAPQSINEQFRSMFGGAHRIFRGVSQAFSPVQYQEPTETVTEGWRNKPKGQPANAVASSTAQLERQTSMQQRYQTRTNQAALDRSTDDPRAGIESKVTGQRLKIYSGGQRHYDMLPKQQDTLIRPFWYKTAGTGRVEDMVPNTLWSISPIERVPPPEPTIGTPENQLTSEFGYTEEDGQYYDG
jgi:hypothetical protein